uniref:Insulin-like peptide 1 n=1 Tax=Rhodnius prolixus TaxID=13249 RepID=A0A164W6X1_RHOPR|nr:insulin-like peptide 1 [Rhodnius prolixus]
MALFWKVLLLAAVICCVTCQQWYLYSDEPRQIEAKRGAQKYCGRILDDTLKFICRGKYNERFPSGKKRATESNKGLEDLESYYDNWYKSLVMPSYYTARAIKRGVHTECCVRPCTFGDLEKYCAE